MRLVRSIPHSSSEPVYCGVPAPLWYDVTAGVFPNENLGSQFYADVGYRRTRAPTVGLPQGHILVNALPADEILCSVPEDGRVVAGLKDAQNYIELTATTEEEPWLDAFAPEQFPLGAFPQFENPPVPFPSLDYYFAFNPAEGSSGYIYLSRALWTKLELAQIKDGTRTVLSWRLVPLLPGGALQTHRISCVRNADGQARIIACVADVGEYFLERGANLYFLEGRVPSEDIGPYCGARSAIAHFRSLPEEECVFVPENNKPPPAGAAFGNELLCEKFPLTNAGTDYNLLSYEGNFADYTDIGGLETTFGETPIIDINYPVKPALYYGTPLSKKVLTAHADDWPSWAAVPQSARPSLTLEFNNYNDTEWEMLPPEVEVSILNNADPVFEGDSEKHIDTLFSGQWSGHSGSGFLSTLHPERGTITTSGFMYLRIRPLMAYKQGKSVYPFRFAVSPEWEFPHNWRNAVMLTLTVFVHFRREPAVHGGPAGNYRVYPGEAGWQCVTSQPFFSGYGDNFGFLSRNPAETGLYWRDGGPMETGDYGILRLNQGSPRVVYRSLINVVNGTPTSPSPWQKQTVPPFLGYVRDMYWKIKPN